MKSSNNRAVEEFKEPIPMKKGDPRVICNGSPIRADFRIISENNYQTLYTAYLSEYERMAKANTKNSVLHIFGIMKSVLCKILAAVIGISLAVLIMFIIARFFEHYL